MVGRLVACWIALTVSALVSADVGAQTIRGVGSSFPTPLFSAWASVFEKQTGVSVEYTPVGTSRGLEVFSQGRAAFVALNRPLPEKRVLEERLIQFPVVMGGVVAVVNIPGVGPGDLRLSGPVLADILLGKITRWGDPAIRELNPNLRLPPGRITVISRGDPSGTTFLLDRYLGSVSPDWKALMASLPFVKLPVGFRPIGVENLTGTLRRVPNSITYVDYAYARRAKLAYVSLRNAAGNFVSPSYHTIQAAALGVEWTGTMSRVTTNTEHPSAWPMASPSYVVIDTTHDTSDAAADAQQAMVFFSWALQLGDQIADDRDFVPLHPRVKAQVEAAVARRLSDLAQRN